MLEGQIKSVMRSALNSTSKSQNVGLKDLRIKMKLNDGFTSTECTSMVKTDEIGALSWSKMLGLKAIAFKGIVVDKITNSLIRLANENSIDKFEINARIYAKDLDGNPSIYLYNGTKPFKQIELKDIL
jgi:hypothetical protein